MHLRGVHDGVLSQLFTAFCCAFRCATAADGCEHAARETTARAARATEGMTRGFCMVAAFGDFMYITCDVLTLPYVPCERKWSIGDFLPMVSKSKGRQKPVTTYYPPESIEQLKRLSEITRVAQAVYLREALDDLFAKYAHVLHPAGRK